MLLLIYSSPLPTISFPVLLPIPSSSFPTPHPRPPTLPPFLASSSPFCLVLVKFSKFASEVYSKPFSFFPPSLNVLSAMGFFGKNLRCSFILAHLLTLLSCISPFTTCLVVMHLVSLELLHNVPASASSASWVCGDDRRILQERQETR